MSAIGGHSDLRNFANGATRPSVKTPRLAIAILLVGVAVFGSLMVSQWRSLETARGEVERALSTIERGRAFVVSAVDAETGQRGYIVTQNQRFLEPYRNAMKEAPSILATLKEMSATQPTMAQKLQRIEQLWGERATALQETIDLVEAGRIEEARNKVAFGPGKSLMDALRAEIHQIVESEQKRLSLALAAATSAETTTSWMLIAAAGLAALALLTALYSALSDNRKLADLVSDERRTAQSLDVARAELATAVSQAQLQLNDTTRLLAAAVANAPIFVWNQDRNLVYRWFSGRPLGKPPEDFIGKSDHEVLPERLKATVIANNLAVIESGQPRSYEISLPSREGERWYEVRLEPIHDEFGAVDGLTGVAIEITDRRKREQNIRLLMRELAHRSKNTLAVVQAMARQTASTTRDPAAFAERFGQRLEALGATHALLVDDGWAGTDLAELIRSQIGHHLDQANKQIFMSGPPLLLPSDVSQNIGLALHELATNAAKYGALSTQNGRVEITWTASQVKAGKRDVTLSWRESGGPPVKPPERRGFGQVVIERTVSRALNGSVDIRYDPAGFSWTLSFPLAEETDD